MPQELGYVQEGKTRMDFIFISELPIMKRIIIE